MLNSQREFADWQLQSSTTGFGRRENQTQMSLKLLSFRLHTVCTQKQIPEKVSVTDPDWRFSGSYLTRFVVLKESKGTWHETQTTRKKCELYVKTNVRKTVKVQSSHFLLF